MIREEEPPWPSMRLSSTDTLPSLAVYRHTEPARLKKLVRGELDWIVMKALEKDRTRRHETANGLTRDVQRYLDDEVVEARPPCVAFHSDSIFQDGPGFAHFLENFLCFGRPHKWLWVLVELVNESSNRSGQLLNAFECPTADTLIGDRGTTARPCSATNCSSG